MHILACPLTLNETPPPPPPPPKFPMSQTLHGESTEGGGDAESRQVADAYSATLAGLIFTCRYAWRAKRALSGELKAKPYVVYMCHTFESIG